MHYGAQHYILREIMCQILLLIIIQKRKKRGSTFWRCFTKSL